MAAEPSGYYTSCENKSGKALLQALNDRISTHTTLSYKSLNTYYPTTDAYPDGKLWDIYSTKHWNPSEKCGNYSKIGDCYNKEHSFPKSWFDDKSPMYSDLHHLYPTDGKVNGQRSNFPYGECANGTYLPSQGGIKPLGRLGSSTFPGYSGKVFEPDDEYKGDLARTYFYMAACYYDRISSWSSDMLAGNQYPAFKSWAIELLLKWHRQDPVSDKEIARNEAVSGFQKNRNPFIDHPELAEHIWGNRQNELWTSTGVIKPEINLPVDGSTIEVGAAAVGHPVEYSLAVRTSRAEEPVVFGITGEGFSVTPNYVSASEANAGTSITLTYLPTGIGEASGQLLIAVDDVMSTVTLKATAVDGLPVSNATYVTDESFVANWTYAGDDVDGKYTLDVTDDAGSLDGYPRSVDAHAGHYDVTGLMPSTRYSYTLSSATMHSEAISVTTAEPIKSIDFLFDGDLFFSTVPGEPSEVAEILMDIDNIEDDITVSVGAPFELSTDLSNWSQTLSLTTEDYFFYLRLNSESAGTFESTLVATSGDYTNDAAVISGIASSTPSFIETFESEGKYDTYNNQRVSGTAATWDFKDAGIWPGQGAHEGRCAVRMGKTSSSSITMAEDRTLGGIGTVSFFAEMWSTNEGPVTVEVQYSTDGGTTYTTAGTVTIEAESYTEYSVRVNTPSKRAYAFSRPKASAS